MFETGSRRSLFTNALKGVATDKEPHRRARGGETAVWAPIDAAAEVLTRLLHVTSVKAVSVWSL